MFLNLGLLAVFLGGVGGGSPFGTPDMSVSRGSTEASLRACCNHLYVLLDSSRLVCWPAPDCHAQSNGIQITQPQVPPDMVDALISDLAPRFGPQHYNVSKLIPRVKRARPACSCLQLYCLAFTFLPCTELP